MSDKHATGTTKPRYGNVDREYGMRLATTPLDDDGPVWMVNLMKYREKADYDDGRESAISGREAGDIYAPFESLAAVGAEVVFVGDVEQQLLGDSPIWDRIAVVKYPTRRSFIEMQARPDVSWHYTPLGMKSHQDRVLEDGSFFHRVTECLMPNVRIVASNSSPEND